MRVEGDPLLEDCPSDESMFEYDSDDEVWERRKKTRQSMQHLRTNKVLEDATLLGMAGTEDAAVARSLVTNEGGFERMRVVLYFSAKEVYEWWSEQPATHGKRAGRGRPSSRLKTEAWAKTWAEYKSVRQETGEKFEDFRKRVMETIFQGMRKRRQCNAKCSLTRSGKRRKGYWRRP